MVWTLGSLSNDDGDVNENGKKAIGWDGQNNSSARASRFFVHFLPRTTTTWKCLISRFVENVNTRRQLYFSFSEPPRKNCQRLTDWTRWNKRDTVWSSTTSLFKWRFSSGRRRCCLSSLLFPKVPHYIRLNQRQSKKECCGSQAA